MKDSLYIADEEKLLQKLGQEGLQLLEETFGLDLSEGAVVAEIPRGRKATKKDIEEILETDERLREDIPLLILAPEGFTDSAAETAWEYEDVVLCAQERGRWVPREVPA